ncbi:MAG: RluA family pseudouridine synthase [Ruminococcus sp.]|jgi:23S rRNA pseudouridine1911/1915/1917 synthase
MEKRWKVQAEREVILKDFLRKEMGLTKRQISQAKFRKEGIRVNGQRAKVNRLLNAGDEVDVLLEEEGNVSHIPLWKKSPRILYEDGDLLIIDKPAGMVSHPAHGHYCDTAANMAAAYLEGKGQKGVIRPVGRLDKDTSGILVFAKNQAAAARVTKQREKGICEKEYLALVSGKMTKPSGSICMPLRKVPGELMRMEVCEKGGMTAVTHFQVLEERDDASLLSVKIETGRTHQIRVHMAWMGHPLLGDRLYGNDDNVRERAALHAWKLTLRQPFTGEKIQLETEVPADMNLC